LISIFNIYYLQALIIKMDPPQTYLVEVTKHIQSLIGNQQHQEAQAILQVKELKQFTVKSKWSQNEIKELVRREISKYKDEEKTRLLCRNWVRRRKQLIKRHYPVIRNTAAQVSNLPNQQCNSIDRIAIRDTQEVTVDPHLPNLSSANRDKFIEIISSPMTPMTPLRKKRMYTLTNISNK